MMMSNFGAKCAIMVRSETTARYLYFPMVGSAMEVLNIILPPSKWLHE
jgi:hypothetical protein